MFFINREVVNYIKIKMKKICQEKKQDFKLVLNFSWVFFYQVYLFIDIYKYIGVVLFYFYLVIFVILVKDLYIVEYYDVI